MLVYAHADKEQKRATIEIATGSGNPPKKNPAFSNYTVDDEDTLKKLYEPRYQTTIIENFSSTQAVPMLNYRKAIVS